jgi:hypothetical protein
MVDRDRWFVVSTLLLALAETGCGGGSQVASGNQTREAKLDGMTCRLTIKGDHDPELTWAVTDRVISDFDNHHVEVEKNKVTLDSGSKPLPAGVRAVEIDDENKVVTISADGKALFGPAAK